MSTYPAPGRGTWTRTGGLLPGLPDKPGRTPSRAGYYRAPAVGEQAVGSAYYLKSPTVWTHHEHVVYWGVRAIQRLVGMSNTDVDGWFGARTGAQVYVAQVRAGVDSDGIVGRDTMKALLTPVIDDIATHNDVPVAILGGLCVNESALDPAAVGINGADHGIAQINLNAHGDKVSLAQALDPWFALAFSAEDLAHVYDVWKGKTKADPWDVAIANHNSPALARRWAREGKAPVVEGRVFQIEEYVQRVHESW